MDFLTDQWITQFASTHTIIIAWVKWLIGTPLGAYAAAKIVAIMNKNTPSNTILELLSNTIGRTPIAK